MSAGQKPGHMPAFPLQGRDWFDPQTGETVRGAATYGITERAYFAARAMQGLLANPGGPIQANGRSGWGYTNCSETDIAQVSVALADALLLELSK